MYTTEHNTAEMTMKHQFEAGFEAVVDFKNETLTVSRNGEIRSKEPIQGMTLARYERVLANIEESAQELMSKGL